MRLVRVEPFVMKCEFCDNTGWVCEDHGDRPLKADSKREGDACPFGAGKPCPRCNRNSRQSMTCRDCHSSVLRRSIIPQKISRNKPCAG